MSFSGQIIHRIASLAFGSFFFARCLFCHVRNGNERRGEIVAGIAFSIRMKITQDVQKKSLLKAHLIETRK